MHNEIIDRRGNARLLKWIPSKGRPCYETVYLEANGTVSRGRIVNRVANARKDMKRYAIV
jgi:hypothetical protein